MLKLYTCAEIHIVSLTYLGFIVAGSAVGTIGEFNVHTVCISSLYIEHYQQYRIRMAHKRVH